MRSCLDTYKRGLVLSDRFLLPQRLCRVSFTSALVFLHEKRG